ncbi:MAG: hypothetical protein ABL930_10465, partial [Pseudobdellovibrio sp.]
MNLLFKTLISKYGLSEIKVQPILSNEGELVLGFHAYAQNISEKTLSGGTHSNLETAKRICIAELAERFFFNLI